MLRTLSVVSRSAGGVAMPLLLAILLSACGGGDVEDLEADPSQGLAEVAPAPEPQVLNTNRAAIADAIRQAADGRVIVAQARRVIQGEAARTARDDEGVVDITHAIFDPASRTIVVSGNGPNGAIQEDIRLVEHDGAFYVVVDVYEAGDNVGDFAGRGIPVFVAGEGFLDEQRSKAVALGTTPDSGKSLASSASVASAAPTLTSISGITSAAAGVSKGIVVMPCGGLYNGARVINDREGTYAWTISGTNFGSTAGSVTIAGRSAKIVSWTSTAIKVDPTVPWTWGPMSTTFTVKTAAGSSGTFGVSIAPAIRSRVFGQCTHHVAYKRLAMGLQPSTSAYGSHASITPTYVPRAGDQYAWAGAHVGIVTGVSKAVSGAFTTYTLTVSEQNAACTNKVTAYKTTFQVQSTPAGLTITQRPKSSVAKLATAETVYFR